MIMKIKVRHNLCFNPPIRGHCYFIFTNGGWMDKNMGKIVNGFGIKILISDFSFQIA